MPNKPTANQKKLRDWLKKYGLICPNCNSKLFKMVEYTPLTDAMLHAEAKYTEAGGSISLVKVEDLEQLDPDTLEYFGEPRGK